MKNPKIGTSMNEDEKLVHELAKQFAMNFEIAEKISDASFYCAYRYDKQKDAWRKDGCVIYGYVEFLAVLKRQLLEAKEVSEREPHNFEVTVNDINHRTISELEYKVHEYAKVQDVKVRENTTVTFNRTKDKKKANRKDSVTYNLYSYKEYLIHERYEGRGDFLTYVEYLAARVAFYESLSEV